MREKEDITDRGKKKTETKIEYEREKVIYIHIDR